MKTKITKVFLFLITLASVFTVFAEEGKIPVTVAFVDGNEYKADDLAAVTEVHTDLAVNGKICFSLLDPAENKTKWITLKNDVNGFCRCAIMRMDFETTHKLTVDLKGLNAGSGEIVFQNGEKSFILHVRVR